MKLPETRRRECSQGLSARLPLLWHESTLWLPELFIQNTGEPRALRRAGEEQEFLLAHGRLGLTALPFVLACYTASLSGFGSYLR